MNSKETKEKSVKVDIKEMRGIAFAMSDTEGICWEDAVRLLLAAADELDALREKVKSLEARIAIGIASDKERDERFAALGKEVGTLFAALTERAHFAKVEAENERLKRRVEELETDCLAAPTEES